MNHNKIGIEIKARHLPDKIQLYRIRFSGHKFLLSRPR